MQDGHIVLERGGQWLTVSDYQEEAMLKAVTQLVMPGVVAEDEAEVAGHLADMGLDTPRATAQVRYQDLSLIHIYHAHLSVADFFVDHRLVDIHTPPKIER